MKPTTKLINISFKTLTPKDLAEVLSIEHLNHDFPWHEAQFIDSLNNPRTLAKLILVDSKIVGYALVLSATDSADLLNICIHPDYQHQGLGRMLFNYVLQKLTVDTVFIEVRATNKIALLFYQKIGFKLINIRKRYYSNGEDGKIMHFLQSCQ